MYGGNPLATISPHNSTEELEAIDGGKKILISF